MGCKSVDLDGRVFLEAAERLMRGQSSVCCGAITHAAFFYSKNGDDYKKELAKYFKPKNRTVYERWFGDGEEFVNGSNTPHRRHRIIALLFLAEMYGGIDHG